MGGKCEVFRWLVDVRQRGGELKKLQAAIEGGTVRKEERIASNSKEGVSHGNSREGGGSRKREAKKSKKMRGEKKQENEKRNKNPEKIKLIEDER